MLVLSRKEGEQVFVGDHMTVTVVEAGNGRVRLGIEAPRATPILRGELKESDHVRLVGTEAETSGGNGQAED